MLTVNSGTLNSGSMKEIKCFLCRKKATINVDRKKKDLLKKELTVFFLVNKLLKISSSLCTEFLEKEGNPSDWFDCCEPCFELILDAEIVSKKIRKLQSRRKCLVQEIETFILKEHKEELAKGEQEQSYFDNSYVCRSIRTEVACRLGLNHLEDVPQRADEFNVTVKAEPLDVEDEDLDNADLPSPEYPESDGDSNFESNQSDENRANSHKCKKCGKQYKYVQSFRSHIKICKSKQADEILGRDEDSGNIHECKNCGKQYKYIQSFRSHIKSCKSEQSDDDILGNKIVEDSNVTANLDAYSEAVVCKVENDVLESPSAQDNSEPEEDQWEPPEYNESLEEGINSGENNLKTDRNESMKRKRGRSRKISSVRDHYDSDPYEDTEYEPPQDRESLESSCSTETKTVNTSKENSHGKHEKHFIKNVKKYKVKSKVGKRKSFTCKCGESLTTINALIKHKKICKKYSYGKRDPRGTKQSVIKNFNICNPETKKGQLKTSEIAKSTEQPNITKPRLMICKYMCFCSRKFGCKHKSTLQSYKSKCQSAGEDIYEKHSILITESEHVVAKEFGYYPCRLCRLGIKDKLAYFGHLIGQHKEHLKRPSKCKCCKQCFIIENDLTAHIENTEMCKNFVEAVVDKSVSEKGQGNRGRPKKDEAPTEQNSTDQYISVDDDTTSSSSSDDYELIDDDELDSSYAVVVRSEQMETIDANVSIDGLNTEEGQNDEEISKSMLQHVPENNSEAIEPVSDEPEKKRLFRTFRCLACKSGFKSPELLNSHIRGIHKAQERPFVCHVCPDSDFKSLSGLKSHYTETHEGIHMSSCPILEGGIEEHKHRTLRKKQKPKPKLSLFSSLSLKKKVDDEFSDPDWDPENMEEYQPSRRVTKKRHFITSEEYDPKYIHECKFCGIKYDSENLFVRHSLFTHLEEIGIGETDLVYHCDGCDKKYSTDGLLRAHKRVVHEGKRNPFECNICHEEFKLYKSYLEHCEDFHTKDGPALCDICNKRFFDEQSKTIHIRKAHENDSKPHRCSVCNVGFGFDMELRYHRLKHFRGEEYMCEFCSEPFSTAHLLKRHQMMKHFEEMGVDPLKCTECGKIFGDENILKKHVKNVHVKDFNFICPQCGKGFVKEESLEKHIQDRHVEGKKFLCSKCPKQFWQKCQLELHLKKAHTEPDKYKCEICTKTRIFTSEKLLKNHMESHSMLYKCYVCLKIFKAKRYLIVHLKGVHAVTATYKSLKGYKADEETLKDGTSRNRKSQQTVNRPDVSANKEKRVLKVKIQSKKRKQESPKNVSECSSLCGNTESTNSSADFNAMPIPLIVPQPQMSTPSLTPSMAIPPRHSMDQPYPTSSDHLLGYGNNQHFMVPQPFAGSLQQNQHPNSSSYFHRNMQLPSNSYLPYSDPYERFPHN